MRCKYCGTELADKSKMCYSCGRFLGDEASEKAKQAQRRRIWIGLGIVAIAIIFVLSTFGMNFLSQKSTNEVISTQVSRASANNLGLTAAEFITTFNEHQIAAKYKLQIPENVEIIKSDANNSFQHRLTERMLLNVATGKFDNKLLELRLLAQPADNNDLAVFVSTIGLMIDTFSPDVPVNDRRAILEELGFVKGGSLENLNKQSVRGEVLYQLQLIKDTGLVLTIKNAKRQ